MASLLIDNLKTDISKHVGFRWWERMDSNHRSEDATDLQSAPIGHSGTLPYSINGAGGRIRTPDLLITNQLLYQLSYTSVEIGLPASYPLYAPKRRIMALKYNINSSGLCQAPFLPDGENFYGSAVRAFPLAFLPRGSKIKEEEKRRADAARHTTEQRK